MTSKQELSYQSKFHQLMCYRLKQPSKTLICMLAVVELVVLHYIVKKTKQEDVAREAGSHVRKLLYNARTSML